MTFPTTALPTELQAVNIMLASVGIAPVTSLDKDSNDIPTNPEVALALDTLQQCVREVQAEGWVFNTEEDYPIQPDTNKHINFTATMLQLRLCPYRFYSRDKDAVKRDGKLYDKVGHTFEWEGEMDGKVYCDVLWLFKWPDIPGPILYYIINKASAYFSQRAVGDPQQFQQLMQKAMDSQQAAQQYECSQGEYSFFGHPQGQNYYNSYQPFHTLYR